MGLYLNNQCQKNLITKAALVHDKPEEKDKQAHESFETVSLTTMMLGLLLRRFDGRKYGVRKATPKQSSTKTPTHNAF